MEDDNHVHHIHLDDGVEESAREYKKFAGVLGAILLVALFLGWTRGFELERFLSDFMAVFFITFAAFKLINLDAFVGAYRGYDIIARRIPAWGYVYPLIEGVLGIAYLLLDQSFTLNVLTIIILGASAIGVVKELRNKSNIMCACLGTVIKLPLSKVSFVEDFGMLAMAFIMLFVN